MKSNETKNVDLTTNSEDELMEKASRDFTENATRLFKSAFGDVIAASGPFPNELDLTELWQEFLKNSSQAMVKIISKLLEQKCKIEVIGMKEADDPKKAWQSSKLTFYKERQNG